MTDEELVQFKALAKKFEPKDKDAVLSLLKADIHPVFQEIHDQAHSAATTKGEGKVTKVQGELEAAKTKVTELEGQITALGGKAPDIQALQTKHERVLADLQAQHATAVQELNQKLEHERVGTARKNLVAELAKLNVDSEYADVVLSNRQDVNNRFKVNEAGKVEVLQAGKDIPYVDTAEKTGVQLLAAELAATVPPKFKNSKINRGSNLNGGTSAEEVGGNKYDAARKEVKDRGKKTEGASRSPGLQRLGGHST